MAQSIANHTVLNGADWVFFQYNPSLTAAGLFINCFSVTTALHIFQSAKSRSYCFIPLIIGGTFEVGGYICRALAHNNVSSLGIFILQTLLLLLAPALFAATIYMILGRLILTTKGEAMAPIRVRWLTRIFVYGDIMSFCVQSGGTYFVSTYYLAIKNLNLSIDHNALGKIPDIKLLYTGKNLILIGLFLQVVFFGFFLACGGVFHYHMIRSPTPVSLQINWIKYMYTLYAAGFLILFRSVFRIVEFVQGQEGSIMAHEVFLYIFDAMLMLGVLAMFNLLHPGSIIVRRAKISALQSESTENALQIHSTESSSDGFSIDFK